MLEAGQQGCQTFLTPCELTLGHIAGNKAQDGNSAFVMKQIARKRRFKKTPRD
jgi:hypothetical protein